MFPKAIFVIARLNMNHESSFTRGRSGSPDQCWFSLSCDSRLLQLHYIFRVSSTVFALFLTALYLQLGSKPLFGLIHASVLPLIGLVGNLPLLGGLLCGLSGSLDDTKFTVLHPSESASVAS